MQEKETDIMRKEEINETFSKVFAHQDLIVCIRQYNILLQQMCELPPGELVMLIIISKYEEQGVHTSATDLVKTMSLSRPAVSRMLHTLEKKGLLQMENDKEDHRIIRVKMKPLGQELVQREVSRCARIMKKVAERVGYENVHKMLEYNQRFCGELANVLEEES